MNEQESGVDKELTWTEELGALFLAWLDIIMEKKSNKDFIQRYKDKYE